MWWTQCDTRGTWRRLATQLPPLPGKWANKYTHYKTKQDLVDEPPDLHRSPTSSCVVTDDPDQPDVYRDQQDCIVFELDDNGAVTDGHEVVAGSLGEFLARMEIDNLAWYHFYSNVPLPDDLTEYVKEAYADTTQDWGRAF